MARSARSIVNIINPQRIATGTMTQGSEVSVDMAYELASIAKAVGTRTVAPKATYLRCSHSGHFSKASVEAPDSQKKILLMIRFK